MKAWTLAPLISAVLLLAASTQAWADEASVWQGGWKNYRFSSSGPLQLTARQAGENSWTGKFSGSFNGDAFEYTVTFQTAESGGVTNIQGTARVGTDTYQWIGQVQNGALAAKFRSAGGSFGEFVLQQTQ